MNLKANSAPAPALPLQRVTKVRREHTAGMAAKRWKTTRCTSQCSAWSEWRVANTAFVTASFLILAAVGAALLVKCGLTNTFRAIWITGLAISLAGLPNSIHAVKYGVNMDVDVDMDMDMDMDTDLLTQGARSSHTG